MLAHSTREIEEREVLHPVVVVHQLSLIVALGVEVEELRHLLLDALLVVIERLGIKQIALLAFTRRVAYHTCRAADEYYRLVSATLQMAQHHDSAQVTNV